MSDSDPDMLTRFALFQQRLTDLRQSAVFPAESDQQEVPTANIAESLTELDAALEELRAQAEELQVTRDLLGAERDRERERYRELFDAIPDACFVTDQHGMIQAANRAAGTELGGTPQDLYGKPLAAYVTPEHRQAFHSALDRLNARRWGAQDSVQVTVQTAAGEGWEAELQASLVANPGEPTSSVYWICRDITARKHAEERWVYQADLLARVHDAVVATDEGLRIAYWNPAAEQLLGWTAAEAVGREKRELLQMEFFNSTLEAVMEALLTTGSHEGEARLRRKDGAFITAHIRTAALRDGRGAFRGMVTSAIDITEHLRDAERLRLSEEKFARAFRSNPTALGIVRLADGLYVDVNYSTLRIFGYTREEMIGHTSLELGIYPDPAERDELVRLLREQGSIRDREMTYRVKSGALLHAVLSVEVVEIGGQPHMLATLLDVTERRRAEADRERMLVRTRELYEVSRRIGLARTPQDVLAALLGSVYLKGCDRASIAVFNRAWVVDDHPPETFTVLAEYYRDRGRDPAPHSRPPSRVGQVLPVDPAWTRYTLLRQQAVNIPDVEANPNLTEAVRGAMRALGMRSLVNAPLVAGGECYGMLGFYYAQPHEIPDDDLQHVWGLIDQAAATIRTMRLLQAEEHARAEAERQNELRLRFLGMISHELRTPLTSIKGFASTLLTDDVEWDADSQRDFLRTIDSEADKLTDMIGQLLDLSRIEAGTLTVDPAPQPLADIVAQLGPQLGELVADHALVLAVPAGLPPVRADAQRVGQVLTNLVGNAAKYAPPGTAITVVASAQEAGFVRVSVGDEGPGIAPEDRPFVFEAFRRGSDGHARQTKGAGLGLAICKGIVEAHGGRIWIEDHPGPGTTVSFTLPVAGPIH
jgi:PAS domain S-box-containing protein